MKQKRINDMTLAKMLKTADTFTVHGIPSSFREWGAGTAAFATDVVRSALAYGQRHRVKTVYLYTCRYI